MVDPVSYPQMLLRSESAGAVRFSHVASPGAEQYVSEVRAFPLPACADENTGAEQTAALGLLPSVDRRVALTVYTQRGHRTAVTNGFFRQAVSTSRIGWQVPLRTWRSPLWMTHGPLPPTLAGATAFPTGNAVNDDTLRAFLTHPDWPLPGGNLELAQRTQLLWGTVSAAISLIESWTGPNPAHRWHLLVNGEPDLIAILLYGVARLLPEALLCEIGFTTSVDVDQLTETQAASIPVIGVRCPEADPKDLLRNVATQRWIVDSFRLRKNVKPWQTRLRVPTVPSKHDTEFLRELIRLAADDLSQLDAKHGEFARTKPQTMNAWRQICGVPVENLPAESPSESTGPPKTPSVSSSPLNELLRDRRFDEWETAFSAFCERVRRGREPTNEQRQSALDQIKVAIEHAETIPFRHRYRLWDGLRSSFRGGGATDKLAQALEHPLKLLLLTTADDFDESTEIEFDRLFRAKLWARSLKRERSSDAPEDEFESLCRAIAHAILAELPQLDAFDPIRKFVSEMQEAVFSASDRPELDQLLSAAEDRGLQLLMTLVACKINPLLFSDDTLNTLFKRKDVYKQLNDTTWLSECRERALCEDSIQELNRTMTALRLDEQKPLLWGELARDFDQLVLNRNLPLCGPRMRFRLLRKFYRDQPNCMPGRVARDLEDWSTLDARCGPLWPDWSEKLKELRQGIEGLPFPNPLAVCIGLALLLPFGAGVFMGWSQPTATATEAAATKTSEPSNQ